MRSISGERDVRVVLKGIHKVNKRLATGELKTYYYAWRGGPQIKASPGSPEFVRLYNDAYANLRKPAAGTLTTIIAEYKASAEYNRLQPSTLRAYAAYIRLIEQEFGDMPLAALSDPRVRGDFKQWRDSFVETPRKADYAWTTLARILSFAKDRALISANPCEGGGRLYVANRTDRVWQEGQVEAFLKIAPPEMQLGLLLALWTGQRQGDLLRLPWSAYDGKHIRLQQSKTRRRVVIPAGLPLMRRPDAVPSFSQIGTVDHGRRMGSARPGPKHAEEPAFGA
jgi:integrase